MMQQSQTLDRAMSFENSNALRLAFHARIPGGAHTYAKGDDQFPEGLAPILTRGHGCRVWDVDGSEFIEYGMGLRAVTLGHSHPRVSEAVCRQVHLGNNFTRPALLELECATEFLKLVTTAEMVKFGKNGSDATSAAIRLSRAFTGRDLIAICSDHPFFSVDDWFIGTTPMNAGIPKAIRDLTLGFRYNQPESLEALFAAHPGQIACVILEPDKGDDPKDGFLEKVKELCRANGAVFVFDELITGFRWHVGGGQAYHGVTPDLSCFGKALGNGFSVSALAGRRDLMRLGGWDHDRERVFLLSLTHGAELPTLAAALEVMRIYQDEPVIETLWRQGRRLKDGIDRAAKARGLDRFFVVTGKPCCLTYATRDAAGMPSQPFRTLFLQETIRRGVLAPSFVVSCAHTDSDIDRTIEVVDAALDIYARALEDGIEKHLVGRPVKPVFRRYQ